MEVKFTGSVETLWYCCEITSCQICLKFGTLIAGTSPNRPIFYFVKILIFGLLGPISGPKMAHKNSERYCEVNGGQICLKFGTLIIVTNP